MFAEDYKIVEGLSAHVEAEVLELMNKGWNLNGPLIHRVQDGKTISTQGMIITQESDVRSQVYVFTLNTNNANLNLDDISGLVHSTLSYNYDLDKVLQKNLEGSSYTHTLGILANTQEQAMRQIEKLKNVENYKFLYIKNLGEIA